MKKITLALSLLTFTFTSNAQENTNFYNFSTFTEPYVDLVSPTSINNGTQWDWDDFGPFQLDYTVHVFGIGFNDFMFLDDSYVLGDEIQSAYLDPVNTFIMDRGYYGSASTSPLSYKIDGTVGNRILKLEAKNVGFENEDWDFDTLNKYISYQIWFYENDNSIEYRFGETNLTATDIPGILGDWIPVLSVSNENFEGTAGYLDANPLTPTYAEVSIDNEEVVPAGFTTPVLANTVYRFSLNPLSVKDQEKVEFSMYPNPTKDVINLTFEDAIDKSFSIYDMTGRQVLNGTIKNEQTAQINVSDLSNGSYVIRIGATSKKFTKK